MSTPSTDHDRHGIGSLLKCKASVSLLPNNLASGSRYLAYIHRNEIHIIENHNVVLTADKCDPIKCSYNEKDCVNTILYAQMEIGEVLIVCTQGGNVHIYDETGQKLIHTTKLTKSTNNKELLLRGIAHDGNSTIYIGNAEGDLQIFSLDSKNFLLFEKLNNVHEDSISCMAHSARDQLLATGDDVGTISLWQCGEELKRLNEFIGAGFPVTSLAFDSTYLVAGYASGHIRIFDTRKSYMVAEITAHARAINAIDVNTSAGLLAVVSEDTYVSVWTLPNSKGTGIRNVMMASPCPCLLTGVRFCGDQQSLIVASAYDSRFLCVIPTP